MEIGVAMLVRNNKQNRSFVPRRILLGIGCVAGLFISDASAFNYSLSSTLSANTSTILNAPEELACANCITSEGELNASNLKLVANHIGLEGAKASLFALQFESSDSSAINSNAFRFIDQKKNYGLLPSSLGYLQTNLGADSLVDSASLGLGIQTTDSVSYGVHISRSSQVAYTTSELARMNSLSPDNSSILAAPVERTTERAELSMLYNTNKMRSKITYQASSFRDDSMLAAGRNASLDDANSQQYSSPLENGSHQLSFAGAYDMFSNTTASALLSMGQSRRTDDLQKFNSKESALGEELNTYSGNLQVMSRLTPHFELNFNYAHEEQDASSYGDFRDNERDVVLADFDSTTDNRANLPQSFRKRTTQLAGQYKLPARSAVKVGVDYETYNRINEEDNTTKENSYWAEFKTQPHRTLGVMLTLEKSAREGDGYTYNSMYQKLSPKQQLLQKYDLASRDRNKAGVAINLSPLDSLNIGFAVDSSNNAYSNSQAGFTDSKETSYTFDANYMISKFVAVSGFYSTELINANQLNGSVTRSSIDSLSVNEDQIDIAGIGLDYHVIANKFDVGFDFIHAEASGKVNLDSASALSDLRSSSDTLHLYSNYKYSNVLHFQVAYRYEKYDDGNTTGDDASSGSASGSDAAADTFNPKYNIGEFALSMRYKF